jgi:hypothetical protein
MPKYYRSVELLGVPSYYQGTYDSLCTYYAAAMLLTTLHPEYHDFFGRGARYQRVGLKVEDPLIIPLRFQDGTNPRPVCQLPSC